MTFWKWSRTASANATADATVNWAEGMPPSGVNDSGRAMMAAAAKYRDDLSGVITTGGDETAYTVSSYQVFDSLAHLDGKVIAFTPHVMNDAAPTLSVDGLAAKPLRAAHGVDLQSNVLLEGTPYVALYNNANAEFVIQGMTANPYGIPLGVGMDYWGDTTPSSAYAAPNHQAISRTVYATLFNLFGTKYGSGDGTTTFNLPPKAGRVSVMVEETATLLTSTYFGGDSTKIGATGGGENVTMSEDNVAQHDHPVFLNDPGHDHDYNQSTGGGVNYQQGGFIPQSNHTPTKTSKDMTGLEIWSGAGGTGSQNKTGKNNDSTPTPLRTVQPTIVCNYIMRVI